VDITDGGEPVIFDFKQETGKPVQHESSPYRVTSENEMRCTVLYQSTPTE